MRGKQTSRVPVIDQSRLKALPPARMGSACAALAVLAGACAPTLALADTVPVGSPFTIGASNAGDQQVARNASGESAFVWQQFDGSSITTYLQLVDGTGTAITSPIAVDTEPSTNATGVAVVAIDDDGDTVVSWATGAYPSGTASNSVTIYAQLYGPDGTAKGTPITVGTTLVNRAYWTGSLSVAMDASGDFVEAWSQTKLLFEIVGTPVSANSKIYARAFSADGTPKTSAFEVDTFQGHYVRNECASVAMAPAGNFTVAWTTASVPSPLGSDVSKTFWVRAQRYSSAGSAVGAHILVSKFDNSTLRDNHQLSCASVTMDSAGDFGVGWGDPARNVNAAIYDASGHLHAGPVAVANYPDAGTQIMLPVAAMDADGDMGMFWGTTGGTGVGHLYGQWLNGDGTVKASQFTLAPSFYFTFSVAVDAAGEAAATWPTTSSGNLVGQLFTGP